MSDEDLCYLPATDALAAFRTRGLSPVELMRAHIARSQRLGPGLNAYTYTFYDRALEQAKRAEAKYLRRGARIGRLEGLPVVIKDVHPMKGEITTYGSRLFADHRDTVTLPTVARLLRAGAIPLARSTSPEFGVAVICHSPLWGVTRNPWNPEMSPGGSSGGAAAALAAGMTALADGGDYGGSIRVPASACGVFGYKPPYGRNPRLPPRNLDTFGHYGPLARTVADAALMQNVMSGPHPHDIATLRRRVTIPRRLAGIRGWKIAFSIDLGCYEVDAEVRNNTREALAVFRALGCRVDEVAVGWTEEVHAAFELRSAAGFAAIYGHLLADRGDAMSDYARARLEHGMTATAKDLFDAFAVQARMYDTLGPILDRYDVFVCPTTALPSVAADQSPLGTNLRVNGKPIPFRRWCLAYPFNMLSQLPVASVPSGFAASGVPTGIQIVGRSYDDVGVFRAAAAYERARPWLDSPAARPRLDDA